MMKEARRLAKWHTFVVIALAACVSAGCQSTWPHAAASFAPNAKNAASEQSPVDDGAALNPHDAAGEEDRAEQARDEVLAFIHRLDQIEEKEKSRGTAVQQGQADAATEEKLPGVTERATPPGSQGAPRTPDPQGVAPVSNGGTMNHRLETGATPSPPRIVSVAVRSRRDWSEPSPLETKPEDVSSGPTHLANVPIDAAPRASERAKIDAVIEQLAAQAEKAPNDVQAQWRLALLRLAAGNGSPDAALASGMLPESAALLGHAVRAMVATRDAMENPSAATQDALAAVDSLRLELRARAELSVPTVALCSRVRAFGMFEPLPADAFRPGVQNQAIVYFAVENFSSERVPDGRMRTLLAARLEVLTADGELKWDHDESTIEDFCDQQREDFFVAQRILLPARLPQGSYVLKVTVEDRLANKRTQALHPFTIGSPESTIEN